MRTAAVIAALAPLAVSAAPAADRVAALPGLPFAPIAPLYSGYLTAGAGQQLHYVYTDALSADPATAPLVVWVRARTRPRFPPRP